MGREPANRLKEQRGSFQQDRQLKPATAMTATANESWPRWKPDSIAPKPEWSTKAP